MINIDGEHVLLTKEEYRNLLSGERRAALVVLERADSHLRGHISNGDSFDDMCERVVTAAEEYVAAQKHMTERVEHADSHSDAVRIMGEAANRWWAIERGAETFGPVLEGVTVEQMAQAYALHLGSLREILGAVANESDVQNIEDTTQAAERVVRERDNANAACLASAHDSLQKEYWYHEWRALALGSTKGAENRKKANDILAHMQTIGISPWSPKETA